jgi:hypothetical protein
VLALDVLEHEDRLPFRGYAGIEKLRNMGVRQAPQDAAFAFETFCPTVAGIASKWTYRIQKNGPRWRTIRLSKMSVYG